MVIIITKLPKLVYSAQRQKGLDTPRTKAWLWCIKTQATLKQIIWRQWLWLGVCIKTAIGHIQIDVVSANEFSLSPVIWQHYCKTLPTW